MRSQARQTESKPTNHRVTDAPVWARSSSPIANVSSDRGLAVGDLAIGGESDTYFDRCGKGMTVGRVSDCIRSSASQMGQDQVSFKIPCSLKDSACSTRLCEVHLALGKPLRPMPLSSSIIFEVLPGFSMFLYPRIAVRRRTLSKRKLERSFFQAGGAGLPRKARCVQSAEYP
jgi:hypothetical protein